MEFLFHRMAAVAADTLPAVLVLVPAFLCFRGRQRRNAAGYLLFTLYLCSVYAAAGLPALHRITFRPRMNTRLFAYMFSDYRSSLLNIIFFLPLGFLLPMLWKRFRKIWRTLPFAFGISFLIEAAQLLTPRATDVNDLLTNTLGAFLGYLAAIVSQLLFPSLVPENDSRDVYALCALAIGTMFFLHPVISCMIF